MRLMFDFLKNLRIGSKLSLIALIASAGFIIFNILGYTAFNFLKINGPLYQRITQGKDTIADVLPPPKYIIESYLLVLQMSDEMNAEVPERLISESKRLRREYEERQAFWLKELPEGQLKNEMVKLSDEPAREFYKIRDEEFIPLLQRGEIYNARVLALQKLKPLYEKHRKHIDRVVELARQANKDDERYAREIIFKINLQLILIGLATFSISLAFLIYSIKQITFPLLKLTKAAEEISSGDLSRELAAIGGKDEVGNLATSFERMRLELQRTSNGLKNEIAGRKRAQEVILLLQSTAILINKADNQDSVFAVVLRRICEFTGWVMGEVWVLLSDNRGFECGPAYYSRDEGLEKIREESRKITFGPGQGLVGQVWVSQRPLWIPDISQETNFLRKQAALAAGLKTAIFIPIIAESKTLAVTDFFAYKSEPEDERLIGLVFAIVSALGPVILRKRYEEELLRANQELIKLDRLKSEFIANVSHELRTPIAMIKEGVSQVSEGLHGELNQGQSYSLGRSLDNVNRLTLMVNNILDVSALEAGKIELKKEPTDIIDLARHIISIFAPQAKNKGLEIKTDFPQERLAPLADKDMLAQVFSRLIENALKFTDRGGIEVKIQEKDRAIECAISDSGKGIAQEDLPKVFDKFQQFSRTYGPGAKGVGLGLAIVKSIIDLHQGKIWVESKPQEGTRFIFILPR